MDGRQRHAETLLRQAGAEGDAGRSDDGAGVRVLLDVTVDRGHRRQNRPPGHHLEPLARMPQIRIGNRRLRVFERADRQESQTLSFDQFLKERAGDDRGAMSPGLESETESDDRMDVASAPDRGEQ